jgi:DNA ligase 1
MRIGKFSARSLEPFANVKLGKFWSQTRFYGLDGELVVPGRPWTHPAMCRETTSVTNTIESPVVPDLVAFDLVTADTMELPYERRYRWLESVVRDLDEPGLFVMPFVVLRNMAEVDEYHDRNVREGYEGTILRNAKAPFKPDRATLAMELWRITDRITFEVKVKGFVEAMRNDNAAKTNALGRTERSTHKENKVGKGMVGMIVGEVLKDVVWQGKVLFPKGMLMDIGAGEMTHAQRKQVWENPKLLRGKLGKVAVKPHGTKDKPRQPTWVSERSRVDM